MALMGGDQAALCATSPFRRYAMKPSPRKPTNVSKANQDFSALGANGLPTDETIKFITISDSDGFKSLKQFAFGEVAPVPETSTWAMMILGFLTYQRKNNRFA